MTKLAIHGGEPIRKRPFAAFPEFDDRELAGLREVLESRVWGGYHPKVAEFEENFAKFHKAGFGVSAANGTVTLETALAAAGVGKGDEVIVPPISFVATATSVLRVGATPVFVDVNESCNLDQALTAAAVTGRTKAIIPVHFAGQPADIDSFLEIADKHGLVVIEDCAHAHGATWRGRPVGSFGDFGSFSFQASKNLTAGEGGLLTANDPDLAEAARSICNQGRRTGGLWYEHFRLGTNYRITGWQAAILLAQLERLPDQLERRARNARILDEAFRKLDAVSLPPIDERVTRHSYYLYLVKLDLDKMPGVTKNAFVDALIKEGIPAHAGYPHPLYKNPVFDEYDHIVGDCPNAERMCTDTFWLSHEIMLAEPEDLADVISAFEKVIASSREMNPMKPAILDILEQTRGVPQAGNR